MQVSFERHWNFGLMHQSLIGINFLHIAFRISLIRVMAEQMTSRGVAITLFHIIGEDTLLINNYISIGISSVVLFVVVLFFVLEFRVLYQLLFASC